MFYLGEPSRGRDHCAHRTIRQVHANYLSLFSGDYLMNSYTVDATLVLWENAGYLSNWLEVVPRWTMNVSVANAV